jgi:site-specific DNA recombinase
MRYFVYCRKSSESEDRQVLSIDSQKEELQVKFKHDNNIVIVNVFEESYSAKAPGRPIFNEMIERIRRKEADGIIAWHPDRLARNSMDGGTLIFLLDQGILKDLKFATYTFENNSQGKFMLSIIFGYSKYYVDNLSENVKRGNRAKIARGWRPNMAPLGYLNDKETKTIIPDPERFPLMRQLFELALTGSYSLFELHKASVKLGLRSRQFKRVGGGPVKVSGIHRILTNPFYAGTLVWNGAATQGAQQPMISLKEFERVQKQLRRPGKERPVKQTFPFTGFIHCGECGFAVTAEVKIKPSGNSYTYYHCTKRRLDYRCTQRSVSAAAMEDMVREFLAKVRIQPKTLEMLLEHCKEARQTDSSTIELQRQALQHSLDIAKRSLNNLTALRIRDVISDEEFVTQREEFQKEVLQAEQNLKNLDALDSWFEPAQELFSFCSKAVEWYSVGDDLIKRRIVKTVGSNPILKDQKLSIEAKKPLFRCASTRNRYILRAAVEDVRTLWYAKDPVIMEMLDCIQEIKRRLPPEYPEDFPSSAKVEATDR